VLFIPDIDSWTQWDAAGTRIEDEIAKVDVAYLDGTFFANGEIPGRDMSGFPHPFIRTSLERFAKLPPEQRRKIVFIHLNHTITRRAQVVACGARAKASGRQRSGRTSAPAIARSAAGEGREERSELEARQQQQMRMRGRARAQGREQSSHE
jgi:hypothetical protein